MALPKPEETLMGRTGSVTPARRARPVLAPIARKAPPKVKGIEEFVGTQLPTEQQKPEKTLTKPQAVLDIDTWADSKSYLGTDGKGKREKVKDLGGDFERAVRAEYAQYSAKASEQLASYNQSVETYNKAIGYLDPKADKAAAQKMLKRTGAKTTVMS